MAGGGGGVWLRERRGFAILAACEIWPGHWSQQSDVTAGLKTASLECLENPGSVEEGRIHCQRKGRDTYTSVPLHSRKVKLRKKECLRPGNVHWKA